MRDLARFGKRALVLYRGGALGEEAVEDYSQGEPVEIRLGHREVPRGIDEALFEMAIGEHRTVIVPPEKAYGEHDPSGVLVYPRSKVADGRDLRVGSIVGWVSPISQRTLPVRCVEATQDFVRLDFNHPLAGRTLEYWIKLVDIAEDRPTVRPC